MPLAVLAAMAAVLAAAMAEAVMAVGAGARWEAAGGGGGARLLGGAARDECAPRRETLAPAGDDSTGTAAFAAASAGPDRHYAVALRHGAGARGACCTCGCYSRCVRTQRQDRGAEARRARDEQRGRGNAKL